MTDNTIRDLQRTVENARTEYAHENGDGFYQPDWRGANEYQADGFAIGEKAFLVAEEDREDYIEDQANLFPSGARYLIAWAAELRIAELERAANPPAKPSFFATAADIVGAK